MVTQSFPIELRITPIALDLRRDTMSPEERDILLRNIGLARDAIVFFTSLSGAKGLSGHSGGAYDIVPEVFLIRAFRLGGAAIHPVLYDEAGHRAALHYLLAVLDGHLPPDALLRYREFGSGLPGHPERGLTPGIEFSSGRLGHFFAFANGVAMAHPDQSIILLGSDGSQMEGTNAEAARLAVAQNLNIKVIIDENDVTISGHPSRYLKGFDLVRTFEGHGIPALRVDGEDIDALYSGIRKALLTPGPFALCVSRPIAPKIDGIEGHPHAHEAIPASVAAAYLEKRGHIRAAEMLREVKPKPITITLRASQGAWKNRDEFGRIISDILDQMPKEQRISRVRVFDNDLEGSCGLHHIRKRHPEVFVQGGVMERGNFLAAAGFGSLEGRQGIFATFAAFLEMCISEITMARLNRSNVLAHFSHTGVDDISDNTCHFGIHPLFADNGLLPHGGSEDPTRIYFPADRHEFEACLRRIFWDPGIRIVLSTRSSVPEILDEDGHPRYARLSFTPGRDDIVRDAEGGGWVVSFGDVLYRALDAVIGLKSEGIRVGLVNKSTLNVVDEEMMARLCRAPFVLVAESLHVRTGLGIRMGTWLLERGFRGRYSHIGVYREGAGGQSEQIAYQGLDPQGIAQSVRRLVGC
ncbi:MAG: thiamine pyrophosphate-dependent enzyme [Sandaracinaceae bacterium]|nr:thiamine pyrophosphate-dependent enzyme [Sandaracinaceae bacterium]